MKRTIIILISFILTGCATNFTQFPERREELTKKIYNASYDKTFDATIKVLESMAFPMKQIDKNNGIIECGERTTIFGIMTEQEKAYARLTKITESSTEVRLTLQWQGEERWLWKDYQKIFEAIDKELK